MLGSKKEPYPGRVLINFWCDYDNKTVLVFWLIFQFCSFWLLSKFDNTYSYTAQMLSFLYAHWP